MTDENANVLRSQNPVLLIGLGGTGKQILLNLRRMFYDQYGVPTLPHIGHIWIDTDQSNMTLDGKDMDFLLQEVDFDATERVNTELRAADLQNIYEHKSDHPHIFSWFDPSLEKHGRIESGAGGIRAFGRLAFFQHYGEIMARVRDKYTEIRDAGRHSRTLTEYGIRVDASKVDTWLLFSIAGGTGSGMFLDMAFALKENDTNTRLRSMALLPSVFSSDHQHRIFANAYAALMELEHYNYAKGDDPAVQLHRFPIAWTRDQYDAAQRHPGPVFDTTYLIGNQPRGTGGTLTLKDKNTLCEMLAEALFIEHGGACQPLAAEWSSKRSNFADALSGTIRYEYRDSTENPAFIEEFCCRYASLGLSKLHIPVQRVATLVRHKLASDLVEYWLRSKGLPPNFDDLVARQYLPRLLLAERGRSGSFFRELRGTGTNGATDEALRQAIDQKRSEFVQNAAAPDIAQRIQEWFKGTVQIGLLDTTNPDPARWGTLTRIVFNEATETLYTKVTTALDTLVREVVAAPTQRIPLAREILRKVLTILEDERRQFDQSAESARSRAQNAGRDATERLGWLEECGGTKTRAALVHVGMEFLGERADYELKAQICVAASKVCERLAELIGRGTISRDAKGNEITVDTGLLKQLGDLEAALTGEVRTTLADRVAGLSKQPDSAINQSLYEEHDFQDFYVTADNRPIDEAALIDLDRRYFEEGEPGQPRSLWDLREPLRTEGSRRTIAHLLDFARSVTRHLGDKTVDVVERLSRNTPPGSAHYVASLQRLVNFGQPWLAKPTHFINDSVSLVNAKDQLMVAVSHRGSTQLRKDLEDTMQKNWSVPLSFVDSSPDRVYVSSERVAFPLMAIPDLDRYRNAAYFPHLQKGQAVHTDVNFEKFQDLLLKRQEEVDGYLAALKTLGLGILAGVVTGKVRKAAGVKRGITEYEFVDRSGILPETYPLGVFSLALRKLGASDDGAGLSQAIRAATANRLRDLRDDELGQWIFLLIYAARNNAIGNAGLTAVLKAEANREQRQNPGIEPHIQRASETWAVWSTENPPGSGFRSLPAVDQVMV